MQVVKNDFYVFIELITGEDIWRLKERQGVVMGYFTDRFYLYIEEAKINKYFKIFNLS